MRSFFSFKKLYLHWNLAVSLLFIKLTASLVPGKTGARQLAHSVETYSIIQPEISAWLSAGWKSNAHLECLRPFTSDNLAWRIQLHLPLWLVDNVTLRHEKQTAFSVWKKIQISLRVFKYSIICMCRLESESMSWEGEMKVAGLNMRVRSHWNDEAKVSSIVADNIIGVMAMYTVFWSSDWTWGKNKTNPFSLGRQYNTK